MGHPCVECGACCATWAVQFDRSEVTAALEEHVVEAATPKHVVLTGTEREAPRCAALRGTIGRKTACTLYTNRPSPCREVMASFEHGRRDPTCDEARRRHGLPRLTPRDWRT
jgi:Fe-S-cluster containining protein